MLSFGVPSSSTISVIWCNSDVPGISGLFARSSPSMQPAALKSSKILQNIIQQYGNANMTIPLYYLEYHLTLPIYYLEYHLTPPLYYLDYHLTQTSEHFPRETIGKTYQKFYVQSIRKTVLQIFCHANITWFDFNMSVLHKISIPSLFKYVGMPPQPITDTLSKQWKSFQYGHYIESG